LEVPGASYRQTGSGSTKIGLRGVSNAAATEFGAYDSAATVGIYLNDIPIQGSGVFPDLALFDLERIEVLKGSQGTLYGEGSMGGAIKMLLRTPSFTEKSAAIELNHNEVEYGDPIQVIKASVDMPLYDEKAGVRLVGTYQEAGGYVDNIARDEENYNSSIRWSARLLAAANFNDWLSGELMVLHDEVHLDAFPDVKDELCKFKTDRVEDTYNDSNFTLTGLTLRADLGFAELTSVTSYFTNDREFQTRFGYAAVLQPTIVGQDFGAVENEPTYTKTDEEYIGEELRLVSSGDKRIVWVAGIFWRDREQFSIRDA
jgi:iron complex outermembrane receptor protein